MPSAGQIPLGPTAAVLASGVIAAFHVGKVAIVAPHLQLDLSIGLAAVGWLTAAFATLGFLASAPAGAGVVIHGDRRMLRLGTVCLVAGAVGGSLAPSYGMLLATRVLEGTGFVLVSVAGPRILERIAPPARRDFVLALWSCFMPAGMAAAMLIGLMLGGWRPVWCAGALLAAGAALAIGRVPAGAAAGGSTRGSLRSGLALLVRRPAPWLLLLVFALYSFCFFALFSFLPVLLAEELGWSLGAAGLLGAVASAANIPGNLASPALAARLGRGRLLAIAGLGMAGCAVGIFPPLLPAPVRVVLCLVFSAVGGLVPATLFAAAGNVAPARTTPLLCGLLMQGSALGQMAGPVAVGGLVDSHGWSSAGWATAGAGLLGALAGAAAARPGRQSCGGIRRD
ncbi:MAG TPA: MFS transporter [Azospirillaceae bacterium]|nr:MFS transporter [Azospirillaceae bacterium]